jgi:hypothetical protein
MGVYEPHKSYDNLIRLELIDGFLVDPCGIRFRRKDPVLSFNYDRSERDTAILPAELAEPILSLMKSKQLDIRKINAYHIASIEPIKKTRTLHYRRGPKKEHLVERCLINLYHIGV